MSKLIYIMEKKASSGEILKEILTDKGYAVEVYSKEEELLQDLAKGPPDLVIVDTRRREGANPLLRQNLTKESVIPLLLLVAEEDREEPSRNADFLIKPFPPSGLIHKVVAMIGNGSPDEILPVIESGEEEAEIFYEDIHILPMDRKVTVKGREISLAPREFDLLCYLINEHTRAVSREELLEKVWGYTTQVDTRVTDDTMKRLRRKIRDSSVMIETVWGYGFRLKNRDL